MIADNHINRMHFTNPSSHIDIINFYKNLCKYCQINLSRCIMGKNQFDYCTVLIQLISSRKRQFSTVSPFSPGHAVHVQM